MLSSSEMIGSSSKRPRQTETILEEARALLSAVALGVNPGAPSHVKEKKTFTAARADYLNQNARMINTGEMLAQCITLLEDFYQLSSSVNPIVQDGQNWTVVKAVMELLVRFGICPYLSDGVGIPPQKRFGRNAAKAAAAAVSDHMLHEASGLTELDTTAEELQTQHPMLLSIELLSSLLLRDAPRSSGTDARLGGVESHHSQSNSYGGTDEKQEKGGLVRKAKDGQEEEDSGFSSPTTNLCQLILSHHLVDVLAGVLQVAYGPPLKDVTGQSLILWRENAVERMNGLAERLPVQYVVEALFILLGNVGEGPAPPMWLKSEVGKLLSLEVMRNGGVATVLERLVGKVEKGSVHVFEKVAIQLARVPRSVASRDEYFKEVCKQLHPLLILRHSYSKSASGSDVAAQVLDNMQLTSILLACKLGSRDPILVERYLSRPIVEPLLCWGSLQPQPVRQESIPVGTAPKVGSGGSEEESITEEVLLSSLLKVQALLTAELEGSRCLRQQLLQLTAPLASSLLSLSYLMWPEYTSLRNGTLNQKLMDIPSNETAISKGESCEGWKEDGGPGYDLGDSFSTKKPKPLSPATGNTTTAQCADAVFDFMQAHLIDPSGQLVPIIYEFLLKVGEVSILWPTDGDIAQVLAYGRRQPNCAAMLVSKLLLWSENWELALSLVGFVLENVLRLRCTKTPGLISSNENMNQESVIQLLKDLEVIIAEVDLHAAQQDTHRSLALLKGLLEDDNFFQDEEILLKSLPVLRSALSQLQSQRNSADRGGVALVKKENTDVLHSLLSSLERLQPRRGDSAILDECVAQMRSLTKAT